jgi:protoporphyrin/coproporphyrin ferrochelatase
MSSDAPTTGILVLNFGEPEPATPDRVIPFLERIFHANARLEPHETEAHRRRRSRELAERRAPGLVEEYEEIGGSPLNGQADAQAEALARELASRGHRVRVHSAFQFTEPLVAEAVERAREEGLERLVGLPVYPLCGHSTNVAALNDVQAALDALGWSPEFRGITGWHRHPEYLELRADAVRRTAEEAALSFDDPGTKLVFSAHGTPKRYLDEGSGYVRYVEEFCRELAGRLGVEEYVIGYQNHTNRGVEWTQPDVESVIEAIEAETVVVDPVSFMHEQSETLAELDHELREEAEARGLAFHRVPVPHDDPRFAGVLADLVEPFLEGESPMPSAVGRPELRFARCRCRPEEGTFCLNALS